MRYLVGLKRVTQKMELIEIVLSRSAAAHAICVKCQQTKLGIKADYTELSQAIENESKKSLYSLTN